MTQENTAPNEEHWSRNISVHFGLGILFGTVITASALSSAITTPPKKITVRDFTGDGIQDIVIGYANKEMIFVGLENGGYYPAEILKTEKGDMYFSWSPDGVQVFYSEYHR